MSGNNEKKLVAEAEKLANKEIVNAEATAANYRKMGLNVKVPTRNEAIRNALNHLRAMRLSRNNNIKGAEALRKTINNKGVANVAAKAAANAAANAAAKAAAANAAAANAAAKMAAINGRRFLPANQMGGRRRTKKHLKKHKKTRRSHRHRSA